MRAAKIESTRQWAGAVRPHLEDMPYLWNDKHSCLSKNMARMSPKMSYSIQMDHLAVLREKIGRLRAEIAHLQELNNQYRQQSRNEIQAQVAHGQRHERLQAIQQELSQLADLGRRVRSVEQMKEQHRSRMHLVKQAS
jgi:phosphoglycerate-specific signal transduction histidine kinase